MRNYMVASAALIGFIGLFLAGPGETFARADDDYGYIPNDHRPLVFRNDDGSVHYKSNWQLRPNQRRRTSEPFDQRPQRAESTERSAEGRDQRSQRARSAERAAENREQRSQRTESADRPGDGRELRSQRSQDIKRRGNDRSLANGATASETLICPVTGDKIASVKAAVGQTTFKGRTYYFCCAGCKPRFDKDPAKFIKNAAAGKFEKM